MIPDHYHYLLINLLTVAYPLAQSYERRIRFLRNWRAILTGIAVAGAIYLAWDELFTALGVWGFNERYLLGIYIGRLPLEEYNFFLTVPFACLFIYEVLNHFIKKDPLYDHHQMITFFVLLCTLFLGVYFYPRLYTSACFFLTAILMSLQFFVFRFRWMGRFYAGYFVALVPFLLMNGWLTGAFTDEPIVWYNDLENMGLRIFSIPAEDSMYLLSYLFLATIFYERTKLKSPAIR
ncbi:MAG: lycopene cyclase domain-containing protein [Flavobacteriales bacterium]|nr:lycopene cyclase domain-containing protein [Flavobacteriales bacterium]